MKTINVKDLMSISGKGGLFRFLAQARNGVIVESLADQKRTIVPATARISSLEDISIFTDEEDMPLSDVFRQIYDKEEGGSPISPKSSNDELKQYFSEVLPNYDQERVYVSDIKKVLAWYHILHELNLLELVEKEGENDAADEKQNAADKKDTSPEGGKEDNKAEEKAGE